MSYKDKEKERAYNAKYYVKNRDKVRAHHATYYTENKEKELSRNAKYADANKEKIRANKARYYAANKEKISAYNAAHKEKRRAYRAKYYSENKDKIRSKVLSRRYGITKQEKQQMLEAQGNVCAMCGADHPNTTKGWQTDHNHTTGKVRAILCHRCNTILHYIENTEFLNMALAYLEKYK